MAADLAEDSRGWWVLSGEALMDMLRRVADGEDPAEVYSAEEANCDREYRPEKCGQCKDGWHYECERPDYVEAGDPDGAELSCCCGAFGLWFDEDGVERWPDGTPYEGTA